jgi:hypothetical protein
MINTKKSLSRRSVLRGAGVALALPLLDAMIPASTALADTAAAPSKLRRLGYVYIPMGFSPAEWTPGDDKLDMLPSDFQLCLPERRDGETDGKLRLLSGDDS